MYKRMGKYLSRANDAGDDDRLLNDIYVPEMTRNGMGLEIVPDEVLEGDVDEEEEGMYQCSICQELVFKTLKEVRHHVTTPLHKKREARQLAIMDGEMDKAVSIGEAIHKLREKKKKQWKKRRLALAARTLAQEKEEGQPDTKKVASVEEIKKE